MRICGCVSKDGEEIDGKEFEIESLKDLVEILEENSHGQIHLNYIIDQENGGEHNLDLWLDIN